MAYQVTILPSAARALGRLDKGIRSRLSRAIDGLAENPRPHGAKKLTKKHWRIRVGDYRIIYDINDDVLLVLVVRVGHRRDVYRGVET